MGNNNYQFRLQSLDVLEDYKLKLSKEQEYINNLGFVLANLHGAYSDEDKWNDIKHTQFEDTHIKPIQEMSNSLKGKIAEAVMQLQTLKQVYESAGVI